MYKKKKDKKKIWIVIAIVCVLLLIAFGINVFRPNRNLNAVEKVFKDSVLFVEKIFTYPVHFVQDKIGESKEQKDLYKKYKELESKMDSFEQLQAEKDELEKQLQELKDALELNATLSEKQGLNATVVNRNIGYWYNTITIDKGSSSGVEVNMAVVTKNGLIGKVEKVSNFNSTVKLLTSNDTSNKTSVKIKVGNDYIYGLLVGYNEKEKTFQIEGIAENIEIPVGSVVTTTGMGDIYPSGIVIGNVSGVTTDHFDLAKIVEVKSDVNFEDIGYVTILKREAQVE